METQAATDYRTPYIRSLDMYERHEPGRSPRYRTAMPTFESSTDQDWRALEPLLAGIDALYHEWTPDDPQKPSSTFGRVARVEFIWRHDPATDEEYRGAVLFDNRGRPLLHAMHALLGYGGSGPGFSWQILEALGVPREMFDEVNSSVTPHDYDSVVYSREAVGVLLEHSLMDSGNYHSELHAGGVVSTYPGAPVSDTWTWWIA